jgi:MFS transporter, Spinster family, sphingosine-1-phosphate transporter
MTTVRLGAAKTRHAIPREGALWMLTLFYVLCIIDRQILNVLAEPIARELNLSDTQIGLMAGLAFAVLYATLGIPLARHADRPGSNRIGLMSVCLFVWSGMTAMSGLAQNFVQMCAARIGVGIGEAGCTPAAHSMIADLYPPERRSSAMAVYGLGQPVGVIFGMMIGGLIADRWGWRMAFMVVGIPGMLVALLTPLLLKDPRRRATAARPTEAAGLAEVLGELLKSKTFMYMLVSGSVIAFLAYGMVVWTGIFFIRTFGLTPGQVGVWLGLVSGLSGAGRTMFGGVVEEQSVRAQHAARRRAGGPLRPGPASALSHPRRRRTDHRPAVSTCGLLRGRLARRDAAPHRSVPAPACTTVRRGPWSKASCGPSPAPWPRR